MFTASPLVVESLLGLLKDETKSVRYSAAEALGKYRKTYLEGNNGRKGLDKDGRHIIM
nr:HEAT repeat domain-containing protein [Nostoc sp. DedQUE02]